MKYNNILENEYKKIIENIDIHSLNGKSTAITGATGLIGSYMIDFLLYVNEQYNLNMKIYAMSRSIKKLEKRFKQNNNLFLIEQDLNEPLKQTFKADYIIHCASNAHPLAFSLYPVETMKTNLLGTINLLEMIKGTNTKFLYISSGEIYGNNIDEKPFTEDDLGLIDTKFARSCYPEAKRAAETLCISYSMEYDINVNIARLCYVYGSTITNENSRADAQFLRNAINNEDIVMKSEGRQKRTYCYVADVVSALFIILLKGENNEVYNISNPNSICSVKEYAEVLAELANVNIIFDIPCKTEKKGYSKPLDSVLNSDKLINLGWKPLYSLKDGLKNTLDICKGEVVKC
ncbi:MAG: NAD-dependent epimerase/dehydratase family protein [Candidatus Gastranaerophilales bacterium]|nr:NAD-dependent epimerase/dehydratase family protein [Candidatus Gastranaerophilales bacterium]